MEDMIYRRTVHARHCLEASCYRGFEYKVASVGAWPCAYIRIPENHPYFNKYYFEIDVKCHSKIDFTGDLVSMDGVPVEGFWIGWRYNAPGDFSGLDPEKGGQYHNTMDIVCECIDIINQLIERGK